MEKPGATPLRPLLLLLAGLAAIAPARAEDTTIQGMRLDLPDGWRREDHADGTILRHGPANGPGRAFILIAGTRSTAQPFDAAFAAFARTPSQIADERPLTHGRGVSVNGHPMRFEQRCCRGTAGPDGATRLPLNVFHVGIAAPGGHRFLSLIMIQVERGEQTELRDTFARLVRSVRPGTLDRAFHLDPPPGGGGLDGLHTHLRFRIMPNAFGGTDSSTDMEAWLFTPEGLFTQEVPPDGDVAAACRANPDPCGTYQLRPGGTKDGGGLALTEVANRFGMLTQRTVPLEQLPGGLRIDGDVWNAVPPLPPDHRLAGTWRYRYASSGSTAFSSGGVTVDRRLTLTQDGRFTRTGFTGFNSSTETGGARTSVVTGRPRPSTEGTYRIEGYRLTLTGTDGTTETRSLYQPDRASDGLLVIGGDNWLRQAGTAATPPPPRAGAGYGGAPK